VVVAQRRYRCRHCHAIIVVAPSGVLWGRHYSASAIGWALALFGVMRRPACEVRQRTSPWKVVGATAARGWATLRRWISAVREGRLFTQVRPAPPDWTARKVAERVATTLAAYAPPSVSELPMSARVFIGAAQAA
jgi:hypothetical protein